MNLIVVAIDNNDVAWYEMLIPFILSLRHTDYDGRLAILGYGLSRQKRDLIIRNGINLLDVGDTDAVTLSYRRFLDVAEIIRLNPAITKAALYDADIWFPPGRHDLFDLVATDEIHACLDAVFPSFVTAALQGEDKAEMEHTVKEKEFMRYGNALQAGLIAGTAQAWLEFGQFLKGCVSRIGTDFITTYGIDTTFLHLWAMHSTVSALPQTQNYVPKRGVNEATDYSILSTVFSACTGPIRAMHMCGDILFLNRWRFYTCYPANSLQQGRNLALTDDVLAEYDIDALEASDILHAHGLSIIETLVEPGGSINLANDASDIIFYGRGNYRIKLKALRRIDFFSLVATHLSGFSSPISMSLAIGDKSAKSTSDLQSPFRVMLTEGTELTLSSESLPGQLCRSSWVLPLC